MNAAFLLFALAGCQNQAPQANVPAPNPAAPVVQNQEHGQTHGEQVKQDQHRKINERMYQLDELEKVKIKIDKHVFNVWVMDTELKRQEGMMFLEESDWKSDEGMIFVFKEAIPLRFWMKNTLVPLDIAYVSNKKSILNTYTMKARDTITDYSSAGEAMYAIELKAGIFKEKKITKGMKVEIPDSVKEKED
jgi:uncharacterized membrane protein (UPF0127 family)